MNVGAIEVRDGICLHLGEVEDSQGLSWVVTFIHFILTWSCGVSPDDPSLHSEPVLGLGSWNPLDGSFSKDEIDARSRRSDRLAGTVQVVEQTVADIKALFGPSPL